MIEKSFSRLQRINRLLERELAVLLQTQISDPRLKMITITQVQVSPDLSHAKIFFTFIQDNDLALTPEKLTTILNRTTGYLRHQLASRVDLRYTPKLQFYFDKGLAKAYRIAELMREENNIVNPPLKKGEDERLR